MLSVLFHVRFRFAHLLWVLVDALALAFTLMRSLAVNGVRACVSVCVCVCDDAWKCIRCDRTAAETPNEIQDNNNTV